MAAMGESAPVSDSISSSSASTALSSSSSSHLGGESGFRLDKLLPTDNAVFSGGFGLALLAAGAQLLRTGTTVGMRMLRRNFLVTLEVTNKDRSYPWVLQWIANQGRRTQHLSVETVVKPTAGNAGNMRFDLVPGPGQHFTFYHGRLLYIQRSREQQMMDLNSGKPWEKVEFTAVGRNTGIFESILAEAYDQAVKLEDGKTIIFTNWGSEWRQFGQPRKKRSLDSVILDDGLAERILGDVQEWMASATWYSDRGIPYRRGYLLHGPPGSGKSSFIMALAGRLGYNICILNLAERGLTDDRLALALSCVPPQVSTVYDMFVPTLTPAVIQSIVLLEDVDVAFPSRDVEVADDRQRTSDVTFSGLLNVLDGVASR
jgi:chaperone BCS1